MWLRQTREQAIAIVSNWHDAYLHATATERRLLNQAIFEKLYLDEQGEIVHEYAKPFDLLLSGLMVSSVIETLDAADLTAEQSESDRSGVGEPLSPVGSRRGRTPGQSVRPGVLRIARTKKPPKSLRSSGVRTLPTASVGLRRRCRGSLPASAAPRTSQSLKVAASTEVDRSRPPCCDVRSRRI
jgi:hypothetical protein